MTAPTIVFTHANGFPAGTYRVLFERWRAAGHRVLALDKVGHDPVYGVTSNWPRLRDQLIDFVAAHAGGERVALVGHSLGGYLSLMAALRRPQAARAVVMIDSPVVAGWRAHSLQVVKATRLIGRVSPGRISQRRRWRWDSQEAVHRHFAAKSVFARWDPRVLQDYVQAGTEPHPDGGVQLAFRREVETRIYNTLPHHVGLLARRHSPHVPVGYLGGTQSAEGRAVGLAATRAVTHGRIAWIEGSHLFPMERPEETAEAVLRLLQGLGDPPGANR